MRRSRKACRTTWGPALLAAALWTVAPGATCGAAPVTQTLNLAAGWNAVFLQVQPEPGDPAAIFNGVPVESVWAWLDRQSRVEFIENVSDLTVPHAGWRAWFAAPAQAMLTNLFALHVNQAYLIKAAAATTVRVSGRPALRPQRWIPDSFNLVGFPVDPDDPPTFATWFAASSAHRGQAVYRLSGNREWQFVDDPAASRIAPGEAYWVWCEGGSGYPGPLGVTAGFGEDGLDYGRGVASLALQLVDFSGSPQTYTVRALDPSAPPELSFADAAAADGAPVLRPLAVLPVQDLAAGGAATLPLTVRRESFSLAAETALEVRASSGLRLLIPVSAQR